MVLPQIYVQFSIAKCKKIARIFLFLIQQSRYPNLLLRQEALYTLSLTGSFKRKFMETNLVCTQNQTERRQRKYNISKAFCKNCQPQNMSVLVCRQPQDKICVTTPSQSEVKLLKIKQHS